MATVEIRLFGLPQVIVDEKLVHFESRKALALIAYLWINHGEQSREQLAALLWPESDHKKARSALRYTLSIVRKVMPEELIEATRQTVAILRSDVQCDIDLFHKAVSEGEDISTLYRDHFMAGFHLKDCPDYEAWQQTLAGNFESQAVRASEMRLEQLSKASAWPAVLQTAHTLHQLDALNEVATRALMQAHAALGNFAEAMRSYELSVSNLHDALGLEPEPKSQELYESILQLRDDAPVSQPAKLSSLPTSSFVGRAEELSHLSSWLEGGERCVTILGPGGMGKTRLALALAQAYEDRWLDGVIFVTLAGVKTTEHCISLIIKALGVSLLEGASARQQLLSYLKARQLLMILDNVEHLLSSAGLLDLLTEMFHQASQVYLLMTSRQRLQLSMERSYVLTGLDWQGPDSAAEQLFYARAKGELEADDTQLVKQLCTTLEGLPLAIELAAALTSSLSLKGIVSELETGLDALESDFHDIPKRHRSIKSVFLQSWQGLNVDEQNTFARLSVFEGGFSMAAMREIADATSKRIGSLMNRALLRRQGNRFSLHELLRQFAFEQLESLALVEDTRDRHALYYCRWLNEVELLAAFRVEKDNLQAAFTRLMHIDAKDKLARFIPKLWHFYRQTFSFSEAIEMFSLVMNKAWYEEQPQVQRASLMHDLGDATRRAGNIVESLVCFEQALTILGYPAGQTAFEVRRYIAKEIARGVGIRLGLGRLLRPALSDQGLELRAVVATQALIQHILQQQGSRFILAMLRSRNDAHYIDQSAIKPLHLLADQQVYHFLGLYRLADQADKKMLAASDASKALSFYPLLFTMSANLQAGRRSWSSLIEQSRRAIHTSESQGHTVFTGFLYSLLINLYFYKGDYQSVLDVSQVLHQLAVRTDSYFHIAWSYHFEVAVYLRLGLTVKAAASADSVAGEHLESAPRVIHGMKFALKAQLRYVQGDTDEAVILADRAAHILSNVPAVSFALDVAFFGVTEVLLDSWQKAQQGTSVHVSERLRRVERMLNSYQRFARKFPTVRPSYLLQRGRYLAYRRRSRQAHQQWQRGLSIARQLLMPYEEAQILRALAGQFHIDHPERGRLLSTSEGIMDALYLQNT